MNKYLAIVVLVALALCVATRVTLAKPLDPVPTQTPGMVVQFTSANFSVTEGCVPATLTIAVTGTMSAPVLVDYTITDGTAKQKSDYTYVAGTLIPPTGGFQTITGRLVFQPGENLKDITVLITEDGFAEGTETLTATLSNPTNAALGTISSATLNINDNDLVDSSTNPIDIADTFVCQLYHDFLHRQPDSAGQSFWTNQITACGSNQSCINERRHNVAIAFLLSIEFQQNGYLVYRGFETALDRRPQYEEFVRDLNRLGLGIEVGVGSWAVDLPLARQSFTQLMANRPEFNALFPLGMPGEEFADKLFLNAGVTPTSTERQAVIDAYGVGDFGKRGDALFVALETPSLFNKLYNPGFVLVEYFGFLRRDPDDPPDNNLDGYNFWLNKLNSFTSANEDARDPSVAQSRIKRSEMVNAFILSSEYRTRFGTP